MNVLISAYACEPNKGSEPGVGWNWILGLSKYCNVFLVTRKNNEEILNKELQSNSIRNVNVSYYDIPILDKVKKYIPFGTKLYYILWLHFSSQYIKKRKLYENVDILHHLTFNTFQIPVKFYKLNKISVWGPIGGGIIAPLSPFFNLGIKYGVSELLRTAFTYASRYKPSVKKALKNYDKVIFANEETYEFLRRTGTKSKDVFLETGIKDSYIKCTEKTNNQECIKLLYTGAIIPRKGLNILIDAVKDLDINYKLTIIGSGSLQRKIQSWIDKNNLRHKVAMYSRMSFQELEKVYESHDIFIFPSMRDTSGNVVLEAMSKGLPIIAFDHQGMHDILDDSCAVKIPISDYKQMVNNLRSAIMDLSSNPGLRIAMGKQAVKRIKENYLWKKKAAYMYRTYLELMNEDITNP